MSSWIPRTVVPNYGDPFYTSTQQSTYVPALNPYPDWGPYGFVLPNCTGMAAGRQIEQGYGFDIKPANGFGDAWTWYGAAANFYERGQDPRVGAIAVWSGGIGGHVATLEYYDPDTDSATFSNSNWGGTVFYMSYTTGHNPYCFTGYTFLGYIYPAGQPKPSWFYPIICKKRRKKFVTERKRASI